MDEYSELINIAYDNMLKDHFSFMIESEAITIFANSETTPEDIRSERKVSKFRDTNLIHIP